MSRGPADHDLALRPAATPVPERSQPRPIAVQEPVNILLVDDQPAKLLTYEAILADLGENLIKASSGTEALRHLLDKRIAVVLVDVCMPDLDGFELAQMIREHPRLQDTAIILISAVFMSDLDRLKGYHSGAVDYVPVPIIPEVLRAKVRVFAELYRATDQLRRLNTELEARVAERTADLQASTERLQSSEQRFRFLAETIPSMVWTATPDGSLTYANQRLHEYVGGPSDPTCQRWPELCVHQDDQERWRRQWEECRQQGRVFEIEVRKRRHDGAHRWFLTRAVPRRDDGGAVTAWFGASTDVHQQTEMHEQLREADRRKDEFLAVLAHELRNPLSPILNAVNILDAQQLENPDHIWCRDVIRRQTEHLSRLVDDLLDVSRITRGKVKLQTEAVELRTVVGRAIEANRPLLEGRRHRLDLDLPEEPVIVQGDVLRLAQVVGNLLNNAAKYTGDGGRIGLGVHCEAASDGKRVAVISVRDNGIGIPASMLPRVFDLFVQVDDTYDQAQGGLGIGLSLVRSLIELHGGEVEARSAGAGRGSEFTVRLPLSVAAAAPLAASAAAIPKGSPRHVVLVADDNADSADSLALLLRSTGHTVHTARDGVEAVKAAEQLRPSVVLLDVGMPRMNGYDAARLIRALPWGRDVLLIAQTGWSQDEDRRRSAEAGFDAHLIKPVDFAQLTRLLASRRAPALK